MFVKDYEWYFKHLMEHLNMKESDLMIVESVAGWCREHGIREKDEQKPVKLVSANGTGRRMLIANMIPDKVIEERINGRPDPESAQKPRERPDGKIEFAHEKDRLSLFEGVCFSHARTCT